MLPPLMFTEDENAALVLGTHWVAVASAEHVRIGRETGFMQVCHGKAAPIKSLLEEIEFSSGKKNWGYQLRFGLFPIAANDMEVIARAMQATLPV